MTEVVWDQFLSLIRRHHVLQKGDTVVAGVSGGPDSVVLLHVLQRLSKEPGFSLRVIAAHLNHGIRLEAGEDAAFVARLAQQWGIEYVEKSVDVPAKAKEWHLALEEAARVARYRFLWETALHYDASAVAVGHHADDQVESVLMHWLRGAGLAGLRGMLPSSWLSELRLGPGEMDAGTRIKLIRPLIESTRADIEAYCRLHGLEYRFDRSNLDLTFYRNRLRHELIPYLERYNPNIREVIRRSARVIAQDYDYLHQQVLRAWSELVTEPEAGVFQIERAAWAGLHPSIQAGLLREAIRRLRWSLRNINWVHIEHALSVLEEGHTGQKATLPQGLMLTLGYRYVWIADETWAPSEGVYPWLDQDMLPIPVPGEVSLAGGEWTLRAEIFPRAALDERWETNTDVWLAYLDADAVDWKALHLRTRRPGDVFQPLGLNGQYKTVREFFVNAKLPKEARRRYPLVVAGEQIVWIPGLRLDERVRVRPSTTQVLVLSLRPSQRRPAHHASDS